MRWEEALLVRLLPWAQSLYEFHDWDAWSFMMWRRFFSPEGSPGGLRGSKPVAFGLSALAAASHVACGPPPPRSLTLV